jgi:hypothetical protein
MPAPSKTENELVAVPLQATARLLDEVTRVRDSMERSILGSRVVRHP